MIANSVRKEVLGIWLRFSVRTRGVKGIKGEGEFGGEGDGKNDIELGLPIWERTKPLESLDISFQTLIQKYQLFLYFFSAFSG